jgi:Flp pilus assembly pilin Flp
MSRIADELHHLYMKPIELVVKKFVKDENKAKKISSFIFHVIIAILLVASGATAIQALKSKSISLATLEAALAAVKGGEVKNYITKLLA